MRDGRTSGQETIFRHYECRKLDYHGLLLIGNLAVDLLKDRARGLAAAL